MVQRFEDLLGLGDHHCIVQVVFVTVECAVGSSIQVDLQSCTSGLAGNTSITSKTHWITEEMLF